METVVIPCLRRVGNTKKYRVVQLDVVDRVYPFLLIYQKFQLGKAIIVSIP